MSETAAASFTLGNVFSRAFGAMSGAAATVFGISFLLYGIPQALWSIILPNLILGVQRGEFGVFMVAVGLGGLINAALSLLAQGALVRTTIDYSEGKITSIGQAITTGQATILPLLGLGIVVAVCVALASILLLVPGIMLFIMWSVAAPALVDERPGIIGALRRSRELTKGFRWKIFGLLLVVMVIFWITVILVGVVAAGTGTASWLGTNPAAAPSVGALIVGLLINTLLIGFWSTLTNSLFIELRQAKEGLAPDALAEVFA